MIGRLIGMDFSTFNASMTCKEGQKSPDVIASEARLIPTKKDEGSLTSVFLSSLR